MLSVGTSQHGSTTADDGSSIIIMSDSCIFWKPLIDEPSKPMPSTHRPSLISFAGIEKCCQRPGRSLNFKSTIFMLLSLIS